SFQDEEDLSFTDEGMQFSTDNLHVATHSSYDLDDSQEVSEAEHWNGARQCMELPLGDFHEQQQERTTAIEEAAETSLQRFPSADADDALQERDSKSRGEARSRSMRSVLASMGLSESRVDPENTQQKDMVNEVEKTESVSKDKNPSARSGVRSIFAALGLSLPSVDPEEAKQEDMEQRKEQQGDNGSHADVESSQERLLAAWGLTSPRPDPDQIQQEDPPSNEPKEVAPPKSSVQFPHEGIFAAFGLAASRSKTEETRQEDMQQRGTVFMEQDEVPRELPVLEDSKVSEDPGDCDDPKESYETERITTVFKLADLEPELKERSQQDLSKSKKKKSRKPTKMQSFMKRAKKQDKAQQSTEIGLGGDVVASSSSITRSLAVSPKSAVSTDHESASEEKAFSSAAKTIELPFVCETKSEVEIPLPHVEETQEKPDDIRAEQPKAARTKKGVSLSSRLSRRLMSSSSSQLELKNSISRDVSVVVNQGEIPSDRLDEDCSEGDQISILSSHWNAADDDRSISSESDSSSIETPKNVKDETFGESLLHVINPFNDEDAEIFSDGSSIDSEASDAFSEAEDELSEMPPRDPFEVYESFSRSRSEDSIERRANIPWIDTVGSEQSASARTRT
ncbi:MAG: hypothetical protein SGILL_009166, partial [Bacillariaceae sp.]